MAGQWLQMGQVVSVQPARRLVRIRPRPGCAPGLRGLVWLRVRADGAHEPERYRVAAMEVGPVLALATLTAGVPRDTVAGLRGQIVVTERDAWRPGPDGVFPPDALEGFVALDAAGASLGVVTAGHGEGPARALELTGPTGEVVLVAWTPDDANRVDWECRRLVLAGAADRMVRDGHAAGETRRDAH